MSMFEHYKPFKVDYCQTCGKFANLKEHPCGLFVCGRCYRQIKPKKDTNTFVRGGRKVLSPHTPEEARR